MHYAYVKFASEWHDGQSSMLYAIASTGNLTPGSQALYDDNGKRLNRREHRKQLFAELSCELRRLLRGNMGKRDRRIAESLLAKSEKYSETEV